MLDYEGFCPICNAKARFRGTESWPRDTLLCQSCPGGSLPRDRALALVLNEVDPNWRYRSIHESSSANCGISSRMRSECADYVGSQYYPGCQAGDIVDGFINENLEEQTFSDGRFDIVVSLDVMEHVFHPDRVFKEIWRTLRLGGFYICTFPIGKDRVLAHDQRCELNLDGTRHDLKPAEYHGNPVSDQGSIVTVDYGYDIHNAVTRWAPFDVRVYRFDDRTHGVIGEFTEVMVCRKRVSEAAPELMEGGSTARRG